MSQQHQTAYAQHYAPGVDLEKRIYIAMHEYLRDTLGLPETVAHQRAAMEVANTVGKNFCDECERTLGRNLAGQSVLDLGSGLGGVATEADARGAQVVAIEPGAGWREIASERLGYAVMNAVGERLPLASNSIDLVVSLQVLEHVQNPAQVVKEVYRVLKPGGYFYFAYENYLGFREPHYRLPWLPLLPKPLGSKYLRMRGRDPRFLLEAVTYTTFPAVRRYLHQAGFLCTRAQAHRDRLRSARKTSAKWRALKRIGRVHEPLALGLLDGTDYLMRMFRTAIYELVMKPGSIQAYKQHLSIVRR